MVLLSLEEMEWGVVLMNSTIQWVRMLMIIKLFMLLTAVIIVLWNGKGNYIYQLNEPVDVILDKERNNLIICDLHNRRVAQCSRQNGTTGQVIIADIDCCKLTMNNNGYLYVSDYKKHEVRRWKVGDSSGTLVAGGNGQGSGLAQLSRPTFVFVDEDQSVYVSDMDNHRVMKWVKGAKDGTVVAGGHGQGNALTQLSCPQGLFVDHLGTVFVSEHDNNRITRWCKGAVQGDVIVGGNGQGEEANQLNHPQGLSFDRHGNLYVVDYKNHRVQRFNIDRN
jgi:sugar lactone lactonase YvrE